MKENIENAGNFFDEEKFLVDQEDINLWQEACSREMLHPFHDARSAGYIRYAIQGKSLIIIGCVITHTR